MFVLRISIRTGLSFVLALVCTAAPGDEKPAPKTAEAAFVGEAPRTFGGVFPCADCEGTRVTLDLHPDQSFVLRQEYLGKNRASIDLGRWKVAEDGKLTLRGGSEAPWLFRTIGTGTLRKLDKNGQEIESKLNYDLAREPEYRLIEDSVRLSGLFAYRADAGRMVICLTGQNLPVVQAGDNAALEKEYALKRTAAGAPLLVTFTGRFAGRAVAEGGSKELVLVVETFEKAWPGEPCPPLPGETKEGAKRTPEGRTWKLVSLRGKPFAGSGKRHPVEMSFDAGRKRASGYTGCSRLTGRYKLERDALSFGDLVTSRAACPDGAEQEEAFLQALKDVTGWRFDGERLQLLERKVVVAEFVEKEDD